MELCGDSSNYYLLELCGDSSNYSPLCLEEQTGWWKESESCVRIAAIMCRSAQKTSKTLIIRLLRVTSELKVINYSGSVMDPCTFVMDTNHTTENKNKTNL